MTRALAGLVLLLALVPASASAATVAYRKPAVGPVLAGSQVAWGEAGSDGSVRVVRAEPREVAWTWAPATAPRTSREFVRTPWAFAASAERWAAVPYVGTVTASGGDHVSVSVKPAAVTAAWGAAPAVVSGELAERGDSPCAPGTWWPESVAVDGARVAVAETRCGAQEHRIVLDGAAVALDGPPRALALAGRWLAWTTGVGAGDSLTIRDLTTGQVAFRVTRNQLGRSIEDIDLDDDGRVLLTYSGPSDIGARLGIARPGVPGVQGLLSRAVPRGIAIEGDRILYSRYRDPEYRRSVLKLETLEGVVRKLATFRRGRRQVGDVDLSADAAVWAVRGAKVTHGRRIVLRTL
jgi:hypothetical protein